MAEEARGNGQSEMPPTAPDGAQQLILNAQYIKDLSFENPRAPQSLIQQNAQPSVDINVDVKAQNLGPDVFEVVLTINATARSAGRAGFPGRAGLRDGRDGQERAAGDAGAADPGGDAADRLSVRPRRSSPTRPVTAGFRR